MTQTTLETGLAVGLVAAVIGTGAALVASMHESRGLFQERELLKAEEDRLQDEWSALWIEMHTLASHSEIDAFARGRLGMIEPGERIEFVDLPP